VEFEFANGERRGDRCSRGGIDHTFSIFGHDQIEVNENDNFGGLENINLNDTRLQEVRVSTDEPCAGQPLTPLAKELILTHRKGKREKQVRTDAHRERDRKRNKYRGANAKIVVALAEHNEGEVSPKGVADMFAKQTAREQIHEATVIDLVAERKCADDTAEELRIEKNKRAQNSANTVTREMKVERNGLHDRISEHQEEIALLKDTAKAVQSSNEDAMKQVKDAAKKEIVAAEQAAKRSDLKAQSAAKAAKKAKEGTVIAEAGAKTIAQQM
jgi:hypothetical protein